MFSGCVLAGAVCTAFLQHCIQSPLFHLLFFSVTSTSILVGALELIPKGLSVWVLSGMAVVWVVLSIGDAVAEEPAPDPEESARAPLSTLSNGSSGALCRSNSLFSKASAAPRRQ